MEVVKKRKNGKSFKQLRKPMRPSYLGDWYKEKVKYPLKEFHMDGESSTVYVIYNLETSLYKIGITSNYIRRMQQLQTSSGCEMEYVLFIELEPDNDEPSKTIEEELHLFFGHKRRLGEWFALDARDIVAIRALFFYIEGDYVQDNLQEHFDRKNGKSTARIAI